MGWGKNKHSGDLLRIRFGAIWDLRDAASIVVVARRSHVASQKDCVAVSDRAISRVLTTAIIKTTHH